MSDGMNIDVRVRRGAFVLTAALRIAPGETVGVIGGNGSGKSTLLGAVAGSIAVEEGVIELGDRTLNRSEPGARPFTAARAVRRVGMLDQRARLFPHMDAAANIEFGPRSQGRSRSELAPIAEGWLARVGLRGRGAAKEGELSGGQQQRVAIARTLAADPAALLLDEPFAAIDVESAKELRGLMAAEIERLGVPAILVTHDPEDLVQLADCVVVLEGGGVSQIGEVAEVFADPATEFAAEFAWRASWRGLAPEA